MSEQHALPIALVGLRCSGKTTLGRALAEALGRPFVDLDAELPWHARSKDGPPIAVGELYQILGEGPFRALETRCLERLLQKQPPAVIATGGGVVEQPRARELLHGAAYTLWLTVPEQELARRMLADKTLRPALLGDDPVAEIPRIAERRAALYSEVARQVLDCGLDEPAELCRRALTLLAEKA